MSPPPCCSGGPRSNETIFRGKNRHNSVNVFGANRFYKTVYQFSDYGFVFRSVFFHGHRIFCALMVALRESAPFGRCQQAATSATMQRNTLPSLNFTLGAPSCSHMRYHSFRSNENKLSGFEAAVNLTLLHNLSFNPAACPGSEQSALSHRLSNSNYRSNEKQISRLATRSKSVNLASGVGCGACLDTTEVIDQTAPPGRIGVFWPAATHQAPLRRTST